MTEKLRNKMIKEMDVRGLNVRTKQAYLDSMQIFSLHFSDRDLEVLDVEDVKDFMQHLLMERKYAANTVNRHICGIRFFYSNVLQMWWFRDEVIKVKAPKIQPVVLSESEVARMIDNVHNVFYKAILMLMYSSGLRQAELRNLKTYDIDGKRMVINVRQGKGGKDRQALLSPLAYKALRSYWRLFRIKNPTKSDWLFIPTKNSYGGELKKKLSHTALGYVVKVAARAGNIKKKLPRTPFGTRLLFIY